ncbi:hypothetical protein [Nocardia sp. NPDC050406]|uniref:hypothetical protein n=1 Tax=Nocardia sp. NPDC050406 TaxID=3364318 RepID=UPI0037B3C8BA
MSRFTVSAEAKGLSKVEYHPSYIWESTSGCQYQIPASVWVVFDGSDVRMSLDIADADALMSALAVALVEHAVAQRGSSSGPKAVA